MSPSRFGQKPFISARGYLFSPPIFELWMAVCAEDRTFHKGWLTVFRVSNRQKNKLFFGQTRTFCKSRKKATSYSRWVIIAHFLILILSKLATLTCIWWMFPCRFSTDVALPSPESRYSRTLNGLHLRASGSLARIPPAIGPSGAKNSWVNFSVYRWGEFRFKTVEIGENRF